jgi:ATP-binding cassette subfamily F protein 3
VPFKNFIAGFSRSSKLSIFAKISAEFMLNIHNLSVSFQGDYLFEKITFQLTPGDRVGLVGKNGAGKSTLLRIISGEQEYDEGQIATDKEISIGFLKQDIDFTKGRTVLEESYEAFTMIKSLEKKLEKINTQLAERTDYESEGYNQLMVDLNEVQHQYEIHGGYNYQGETERILQGLGFQREDFNKLTETFSGGWRMRIELAKLLLQNNDILLLDEPTNHLDIESILWLEDFLRNYPGVVVVVSHDKMFLDTVTNRTIEISLGKIYDYNKPYSKYLVLRNEMREQQLASQKNQQKQIEQTEKLIEKFRAKASKATMAQSLIKKLDKIDRIEVDEDDNSVMTLNFPISITPGKVVIEAENVSKSYGDKEVLRNIDLMIERDSKTAFVGQNGQGKSTLAKIIVGEIPHGGTLKLGHNVQIAYFAQNQADHLDGSKTVLDTMIDAANEKNRSKVRDILGAFLFRGDEVEKYVRVLSGGERNRLALAKLLLQPFNVLVMDEPTNHLDIKSKNVLKEALKNFEGTLILVSHDRDFLQGLSTKVYEFKDHKIKEYLGDIEYFLEQRNLQNLREAEKRSVSEKKEKPNDTGGKQSYENQKKLKSFQNKLSKIEAGINKLEREIKEIDVELAVNYDQTIAKPGFFDGYQAKKDQLNSLMEEWEEVSLKLERIKA